jgi:hypothetical protein
MDGNGGETTTGLWQTCSSSGDSKDCSNIKCPQSGSDTTGSCSKILAARAFVTLACITSAISALCLLLSVGMIDKTRQILINVGKGLAFACLILGIIGIAVGISVSTGTGTEAKMDWGAASIIGIVLIFINLAGAILSVFIN